MKKIALFGCGLLLAASWGAFAGNVEVVQRYEQGLSSERMATDAVATRTDVAESDTRARAQAADSEVRELGSMLWSDSRAEVRELGSMLWGDSRAEVRELGSMLWAD